MSSQSPVSAGDALTFDTNQVEEGTAISHTASSSDFTLNDAGTYRITYSATGTNTGGTGNAVLQLEANSTEIPGSKSSGTVSATSNTVPLGASVLYTASAGDVITLNMVDADASFTDAAIVIQKVD